MKSDADYNKKIWGFSLFGRNNLTFNQVMKKIRESNGKYTYIMKEEANGSVHCTPANELIRIYKLNQL
jgi:hypothetical protein